MPSTPVSADNVCTKGGNAMRQQQLERKTKQHREHKVDDVEADTSKQAPTLDEIRNEMAEILEEIDEVLEENAEEFVTGFVQKGGQ
jgi:ubiquitin-like protein Pup